MRRKPDPPAGQPVEELKAAARQERVKTLLAGVPKETVWATLVNDPEGVRLLARNLWGDNSPLVFAGAAWLRTQEGMEWLCPMLGLAAIPRIRVWKKKEDNNDPPAS